MKKPQIGIIGVGMVGGSLQRYFESKKIQPKLFDKYKKIGSPAEVRQSKTVFICVPTPFHKTKGFDDSALLDAISLFTKPMIIVIKSTVLPGTTDALQKKFPQHRFLFNPEFLVEKKADHDTCHPDRQIVGYTSKSLSIAEEVLDLLPHAPSKFIVQAAEAEMIKYFGNAFLGLKVTFANQMYDLCQVLGIDYGKVNLCAGSDPRIGISHLDVQHGGYRGYGGKCLPKDIGALLILAKKNHAPLPLLDSAARYNDDLLEKQNIKNPENPC